MTCHYRRRRHLGKITATANEWPKQPENQIDRDAIRKVQQGCDRWIAIRTLRRPSTPLLVKIAPKRRAVLSMTDNALTINGNEGLVFPGRYVTSGFEEERAMAGHGSYLKKHTEALVKDVGIEPACDLTGKSKATLGRYYSEAEEHRDRFMPVDAVAALEAASSYPHVTSALAELRGITMSYDAAPSRSEGGVNSDVIKLSQRFALLMEEYNRAIQDGVISINEAKRLLRETTALQRVLIDMKMHLEENA